MSQCSFLPLGQLWAHQHLDISTNLKLVQHAGDIATPVDGHDATAQQWHFETGSQGVTTDVLHEESVAVRVGDDKTESVRLILACKHLQAFLAFLEACLSRQGNWKAALSAPPKSMSPLCSLSRLKVDPNDRQGIAQNLSHLKKKKKRAQVFKSLFPLLLIDPNCQLPVS